MDAQFVQVVAVLVLVLEAVGVAVIFGGFIIAGYDWLAHFRHRSNHEAYLAFRRRSVRGLILGLEFLVAADIIRTITVDLSVSSVLSLALIVLVRTFLVFALHLEIEGRLPWQGDPGEATERASRADQRPTRDGDSQER